MSLAEDLRTYLVEHEDLLEVFADPVIQLNTVDQTFGTTRIWYQRSGGEQDLLLSGARGLASVQYDLEVMSLDAEEVISISDVIKELLHGYQGVMGDSFVHGCFVDDLALDDYISKGQDEDEGLNIAALRITIIQ